MADPAILTDVNGNPEPQEADSNGNWIRAEAQSTTLLAAGTATAAAADGNITPTNAFEHISIKNDDATNAITFTIDELSTGTPARPVIVKAGETFEDYIRGSVLHYSASSGSPSFRYVIR